MSTRFKELVISGPFGLVKGFLLGYRAGCGGSFGYFFHRKSGIRRDTLAELVKEALEVENYVHVCLEESAVEGFGRALAACRDCLGLEVSQVRDITGAHFGFSFNLNNRELADQVKKVFSAVPEGVSLEGYAPEEKDSQYMAHHGGTVGYAPLHDYTFTGQGVAAGDFSGVMDLFLRARRMPQSSILLLGEMSLEFGS
ncbi:hypothetical protein LLH00_00280 [bacterium]|nr:hypothetical protein [bacterium]